MTEDLQDDLRLMRALTGASIKRLPVMIRSPLHEDKTPSFSIFIHQGKLFWKDHALDESGRVHKLSRIMGRAENTHLGPPIRVEIRTKSAITALSTIGPHDEHRAYLDGYHIPFELARTLGFEPLGHLAVNGRQVIPTSFGFYVRTEHCVQVYVPLGRPKHLSNGKELWPPDMGEEAVVLTSGLKDALALRAQGLPAYTAGGEGLVLDKIALYWGLKRDVFTLFDNDDAGTKASLKAQEFGWTSLGEVLRENDVKDAADLMRDHPEKSQELLRMIKK